MEYPYLGVKTVKETEVVVMFTSVNEGTVIASQIDDEMYKFGVHCDNFNEEEFDFFPANRVVRLQN